MGTLAVNTPFSDTGDVAEVGSPRDRRTFLRPLAFLALFLLAVTVAWVVFVALTLEPIPFD